MRYRDTGFHDNVGTGSMRGKDTKRGRRRLTGGPHGNYSQTTFAQVLPHLGTESKRSSKWWIRCLKGRMTQLGP